LRPIQPLCKSWEKNGTYYNGKRLRWFGHVLRMDEERLPRQALQVESWKAKENLE